MIRTLLAALLLLSSLVVHAAAPVTVGRDWEAALCADGTLRTDGCDTGLSSLNLAGYGTVSTFGSLGPVCLVTNTAATGAGTMDQCYLDYDGTSGMEIRFTAPGVYQFNDRNWSKPFITVNGRDDGAGTPHTGGQVVIELADNTTQWVLLANDAQTNNFLGHSFRLRAAFGANNRWSEGGAADDNGAQGIVINCSSHDRVNSLNIVFAYVTVDGFEDAALENYGNCKGVTVQNTFYKDLAKPYTDGYFDSTQAPAQISRHHNLCFNIYERCGQARSGVVDYEYQSNLSAGWGLYGLRFNDRNSPTVAFPDRVNVINSVWLDADPPANLQQLVTPLGTALEFVNNADPANVYGSGNVFPTAETDTLDAPSRFARVADGSIAATETLPENLSEYFWPGGDTSASRVGAPNPTADDIEQFNWVRDQLATQFGGGTVPVLSNISAPSVSTDSATIQFETTVSASGTVEWALRELGSCSPMTPADVKAGTGAVQTEASPIPVTTSPVVINLSGLTADTDYCFDPVQNVTAGDSNVLSLSFSTPAAPPVGQVTLSWDEATTLYDGTTIGAGVITGTEIWRGNTGHQDPTLTLETTVAAGVTSVNVPDDGVSAYFVRHTWDDNGATAGGHLSRTELSWPAELEWHFELSDCDTTISPTTQANFESLLDPYDGVGGVVCVNNNGGAPNRLDFQTSTSVVNITQSGTPGNRLRIITTPGQTPAHFQGACDEALQDSIDQAGGATEACIGGNGNMFSIEGDYVDLYNLEFSYADRHNLVVGGRNQRYRMIRSHSATKDLVSINPLLSSRGPQNIEFIDFDIYMSRHGIQIGGTGGGATDSLHDAWLASPSPPNYSQIASNIVISRGASWAGGKHYENGVITGSGSVLGDPKGGGNTDGLISGSRYNLNTAQDDWLIEDWTYSLVSSWYAGDNGVESNHGGDETWRDVRLVGQKNPSAPFGSFGAYCFKTTWSAPDNGVKRVLGVLCSKYPEQADTGGPGISINAGAGNAEQYYVGNSVIDNGISGGGSMYYSSDATHNTTVAKQNCNMAHDTGAMASWAGFEFVDNWQPADGDPLLNDSDTDLTDPKILCPGCNPKHTAEIFFQHIDGKYMLSASSPARDTCTKTDSALYSTKAADDLTDPSNPVIYNLLQFFDDQTPTDSANRDPGAVQYRFMPAPTNVRFQ